MAYWRSSTMGDVSDENERGDVALVYAGDLQVKVAILEIMVEIDCSRRRAWYDGQVTCWERESEIERRGDG